MATPIDLLDAPAMMSYGGLVDASTVEGHVDDVAGWCGASAVLAATLIRADTATRHPRSEATRRSPAPMRRGTQWRHAARERG
jgi:hypothetical protein